MLDLTCESCGKPVRRYPSAVGKHVYCSWSCARNCTQRARSAPTLPTGEALARYLAAADATLRAEIRARMAAGRSLVLADCAAFTPAATSPGLVPPVAAD